MGYIVLESDVIVSQRTGFWAPLVSLTANFRIKVDESLTPRPGKRHRDGE